MTSSSEAVTARPRRSEAARRGGWRAPRSRPTSSRRRWRPSRSGPRARRAPTPSASRRTGSATRSASTRAHTFGSWPSTRTPLRPSADGGGQATDRARHHRRAAGLRLDGHEPEGLAVGRDDDEVGGAVVVGQDLLADGRVEADHPAHAERPGQLVEALGVRETRPARPTDDRRRPAGRGAKGSAASISAAARTSTSGALSGWIRPDEHQDDRVGRQADPLPCRGAVTGGEAIEVDSRADDANAAGVGAVEVDELARPRPRCWPRAGRRPRRPGPRRCCASPAPGRRPRPERSSSPSPSCASSAPAGRPTAPWRASRPVPTASSGCARGRSSPARAGPRRAGPRSSPRTAARAGPPSASPSYGPAATCRTSTPGASSTVGGQVPARRPREDLDLGAGSRQAAGELDDVDVHAAGVTGARAGPAGRCARSAWPPVGGCPAPRELRSPVDPPR